MVGLGGHWFWGEIGCLKRNVCEMVVFFIVLLGMHIRKAHLHTTFFIYNTSRVC